jgi:opacity protein-like surface antigen
MRIAPYLGAGVGVVWHEFTQTGDFVDFDTLDISFDRLQTSGSSAILDARMGVDVSLSRRVFLVGEMRYDFGSDSTGGDYVGFDDIDLSGFKLAFGVSFRL